MNNRNLKNNLFIIFLLLGSNEILAQMNPPGGGGGPVGGGAPLEDHLYLWLLPMGLYGAYTVVKYYKNQKKA